jgi:hypothetical protein
MAAGRPPACLDTAIAAQSDPGNGQKLVEVGPQGRSDAVWVTKIIIGDQEVHPGTPFQAGNDWLGKMSISLENRTNKTIEFSTIVLGFPETGDGRTQPQRMFDLHLGRPPAVDAFNDRTGKPIPIDPAIKPLSFVPNQTLEIRVADYMGELKAYVERSLALAQVTHCVIHRGTFFFSDGMRWNTGGFSVPDPDHPGKFTDMAGRYFPSDGRRVPQYSPGGSVNR